MDGCLVKVGLITMVDRKFMAVAISAIFVLGMYGPNVAEIIQSAEAHGVQAQLQSRFIQIQNEAITRQSLSTGETLVLSGTLVSLVERDQRGWISLFSESTNSGNRWEIMARDPPMGNACVSEHYDFSCICSNICYKTLASNLTNKLFFHFNYF